MTVYKTVVSPKGTAHLADPNRPNRMLCDFTIHPHHVAGASSAIQTECEFCKKEKIVRDRIK